MTDTPHLHALAMRTDAADACSDQLRNTAMLMSNPPQSSAAQYARAAILALPLEADPAALVQEALKLPEIAALVADAKIVCDKFAEDRHYFSFVSAPIIKLYAALTALEKP